MYKATNSRDALVVYQDAVKDASPESEQLQQIQTQIDQAEKQLAFDRENFKRYEDLKKKNSVSQLEFEKVGLQLEASRTTSCL